MSQEETGLAIGNSINEVRPECPHAIHPVPRIFLVILAKATVTKMRTVEEPSGVTSGGGNLAHKAFQVALASLSINVSITTVLPASSLV